MQSRPWSSKTLVFSSGVWHWFASLWALSFKTVTVACILFYHPKHSRVKIAHIIPGWRVKGAITHSRIKNPRVTIPAQLASFGMRSSQKWFPMILGKGRNTKTKTVWAKAFQFMEALVWEGFTPKRRLPWQCVTTARFFCAIICSWKGSKIKFPVCRVSPNKLQLGKGRPKNNPKYKLTEMQGSDLERSSYGRKFKISIVCPSVWPKK